MCGIGLFWRHRTLLVERKTRLFSSDVKRRMTFSHGHGRRPGRANSRWRLTKEVSRLIHCYLTKLVARQVNSELALATDLRLP